MMLPIIKEVCYSVGDLEKIRDFFVNFGGWKIIATCKSSRAQLDKWQLPDTCTAQEILLQCEDVNYGRLRLIKFENIVQDYIRSSQQPWDIGGIMDINIRVPEVAATFDHLREMGWHGLSDPLLQEMGPFKLYDILMRGYDDTIIAFTHRLQPPMDDLPNINFAAHIYNSSITVEDYDTARDFYTTTLQCTILNEYEVVKDGPQENMFGLPHNMADKVTAKACILSFNGNRETIFQIIKFEGVVGKNVKEKAKAPNRGFLSFRVFHEDLERLATHLSDKNITIQNQLHSIEMAPYGQVKKLDIVSPNGVIWEMIQF